MKKKKVAIIIPWFGKELKGGAEQHAWQVATRLANKDVEVTVLTTCSKEFTGNWDENFYKAGKYNDNRVNIIRFPVKKRNKYRFDIVVAKLLSLNRNELLPAISPLNKKEETIFINENINSPKLIKYLKNNYLIFDALIFIPYLYGPILKGLEKVKERSILVPCLHDEAYAYLNCVANIFYSSEKVLFISHGEEELSIKLFGPSIIPKATVIGAGVEIDVQLMQNYENPQIVDGDYLLYLGRRDVGKNTDLLIDSFDSFIEQTKSRLKLVLAGTANLPIKPISNQIIDLGLVSDDEKNNLLKHAD